MKNIVYVYSGDPKEYEPDNEYDAVRMFENGELTYMIEPDLLDEETPIYVVNHLAGLTLDEIMKRGKIFHSTDFRNSLP